MSLSTADTSDIILFYTPAINISFISSISSHHIVHYEGQGGPVQPNSKPRPEVLALCGRAAESFRPDIQHLFTHLKPDPNSSIYAATHPKLVQNPT